MRPRCICGFSMCLEPDGPAPFGLAWQIQHREAHLAMFPALDADSVAELDLFIAAERARTVSV